MHILTKTQSNQTKNSKFPFYISIKKLTDQTPMPKPILSLKKHPYNNLHNLPSILNPKQFILNYHFIYQLIIVADGAN